ncbi:hypothetical protein [Archaeoglobus sp.]
MNSLDRYVTILKLLNNVRKEVGKTFIQKGVYILQSGLGRDLGYSYKLYFYGPFSQELANDLDTLHETGLIDVRYDVRKGWYSIKITEKGKMFLEKFKEFGARNSEIEEVLSLIEGKDARKMELLGTVLYFAKLTSDLKEIKRLVNIVKPHFNDREIEEALMLLREEELV